MNIRTRNAKLRKRLIKKYWGNAMMDGETRGRITFGDYQRARREAWEHGMKVGLRAGLSAGKSGSDSK